MLLPFVMPLTLTTMAHCDAVGRGIHAINRVVQIYEMDCEFQGVAVHVNAAARQKQAET